ncbi:unnamed protein product [Zymoseptoria tritici ST99CH_3D7]|uniref:Uncharacterized protein n=1 Tax=Zymoseptoria tritici (strain ST99CH_3D7) TaxID=1276538 RepID=A0A1X7RTY9_ZYMT9|nr:unnamed protein product [Zymoseptoria tritici ST99CH_3D7]
MELDRGTAALPPNHVTPREIHPELCPLSFTLAQQQHPVHSDPPVPAPAVHPPVLATTECCATLTSPHPPCTPLDHLHEYTTLPVTTPEHTTAVALRDFDLFPLFDILEAPVRTTSLVRTLETPHSENPPPAFGKSEIDGDLSAGLLDLHSHSSIACTLHSLASAQAASPAGLAIQSTAVFPSPANDAATFRGRICVAFGAALREIWYLDHLPSFPGERLSVPYYQPGKTTSTRNSMDAFDD